MGVLSAILKKIQQNRELATVVGGGVGALGGSLLDDEGEYGSTLGLGASGALLGFLGGGRRIPRQFSPQEVPDVGERGWFAQTQDAPSSVGLGQRTHENLVDSISRWYGKDPEREKVISNLYHGGMSEADLVQHGFTNDLEALQQQGLLEEFGHSISYANVPRIWDTVRFHQQQARQKAARARGAGNEAEFQKYWAEYQDLTRKLDDRAVAPANMTEEDALSAIADQQARLGPESYGLIDATRRRWADKLWEITEARNRMGDFDPEFFQRISDQRARGLEYFPAFRNNMELTPEGTLLRHITDSLPFVKKGGIQVSDLEQLDAFKQMTGGTQPFANPISGALYYAQESIRQGKRNAAVKTMVDGVYADGLTREDGTPLIREVGPTDALAPGESTVSFVEGGQTRNFAVPADWAEILQAADAEQVSAGLKVMSTIQRINAGLITGMNVAFVAPNVFRDIQAAWLLTKQNPTDAGAFIKYWLKAFAASMSGYRNPDALTREAFAEGALGANLTRQLKWKPEWMEAAGLQEPSVLGNIVSRLQSVTGATEEATKIASYKLQRERGVGAVDAAFNTRRYAGSPDFNRQGALASAIRPWVQFWNPQIQGITRNFERAMQDPAYMAKWAGVLTAGYLGLDAYNRSEWFIDPQTGRPYIEDVPEWEKATNIIIFLPPQMFGMVEHSNGVVRPKSIKIPLDHLARQILSPIMSATQVASNDPNAPSFVQAISNFASQSLPLHGPIDTERPIESLGLQLGAMTNPLIRVPVEQLADRQAFSNSPIEGHRLSGLIPSERYTEATAGWARGLGQATGLSPVRIEHAVRGLLPGLPSQILDAATPDQRVAGSPQELLAKIPILGTVPSRFTVGKGSAERERLSEGVYETMAAGETATRTLNNMAERDPLSAGEFAQRTGMLREIGNEMRGVAKELSKIREAREHIIRNPQLSPEERRRHIQQLEMAKMQILRNAAHMTELAKPGREALQ